MCAQKIKNGAAVTEKLAPGWHDEIAQDVFEIWIGISRLMARVSGADRRLETSSGAGRPPGGGSFAPRRKTKAS